MPGEAVIDPAAFAEWVKPVPVTKGRAPVISHEFEPGPRYLPNGALNYATHLGLDLMFPRLPTDPTGPATDVAIPKHGPNPGWITWPDTQIIAAGPGKVWSAKLTGLGHSVLIDHGSVGGVPMLTFYQHLEDFSRSWQKGDTVTPGTPLGTMGGDPSNVPHLRHLHFEIWLPEGKAHEGDWPVNPEPYLRLWAQV